MGAAMSVSELTDPKRISLTLDPGLVLERLILQRFSVLKRKRGQDWLRALLVQGFLAEGQWIRSDKAGNNANLVPRETTVPATPFANWLGRAHPANRIGFESAPAVDMAVTMTPTTSTEPKPFAHLRKVVG